jgi:hypothetical protein
MVRNLHSLQFGGPERLVPPQETAGVPAVNALSMVRIGSRSYMVAQTTAGLPVMRLVVGAP